MARAREDGEYIIRIHAPSGNVVEVLRERSEAIGHGGAPDGAITNSPEKWKIIPRMAAPNGQPFGAGCEITLVLKTDGADTLDISDARFVIPMMNAKSGVIKYLTNVAANVDWCIKRIGDSAIVADVETEIIRWRIPPGGAFYFGGAAGFISIEDDTA